MDPPDGSGDVDRRFGFLRRERDRSSRLRRSHRRTTHPRHHSDHPRAALCRYPVRGQRLCTFRRPLPSPPPPCHPVLRRAWHEPAVHQIYPRRRSYLAADRGAPFHGRIDAGDVLASCKDHFGCALQGSGIAVPLLEDSRVNFVSPELQLVAAGRQTAEGVRARSTIEVRGAHLRGFASPVQIYGYRVRGNAFRQGDLAADAGTLGQSRVDTRAVLARRYCHRRCVRLALGVLVPLVKGT